MSYSIETDKLDALYKRLKPKGVTMTALLAKACGVALVGHPLLHAGERTRAGAWECVAESSCIHGDGLLRVTQLWGCARRAAASRAVCCGRCTSAWVQCSRQHGGNTQAEAAAGVLLYARMPQRCCMPQRKVPEHCSTWPSCMWC